MRFLIDENLPADLAETAREAGVEVALVRDVLPGAKDAAILARLRTTREALVTRDVRFANLGVSLIASGGAIDGVVLIREQGVEKIRAAWKRFLASPRQVAGVTVLTATRTRFRRLVK